MKISVALISLILLTSTSGNISGNKTSMVRNEINNVLILTDANFDKSIKEGIVLVDFWAVWCGPCRILSPIIEEIAFEMKDKVKVGKLDTDKNLITATKYNIRYLPTVIIFKNGTPQYTFTGVQSKDTYINALTQLLK